MEQSEPFIKIFEIKFFLQRESGIIRVPFQSTWSFSAVQGSQVVECFSHDEASALVWGWGLKGSAPFPRASLVVTAAPPGG